MKLFRPRKIVLGTLAAGIAALSLAAFAVVAQGASSTPSTPRATAAAPGVLPQALPGGRITLRKVLVPSNDPGRFDLNVDAYTLGVALGNGGVSRTVEFLPGYHMISESPVGPAIFWNYTSSIICLTTNVSTGASATRVYYGTAAVINLKLFDFVDCQFINIRSPLGDNSRRGFGSFNPGNFSPDMPDPQ